MIDGETQAVREWLAKEGYDPAMGARPMARVIQEQLKRPIAEELLFGRLVDGGSIYVDRNDQGFTFEIEEKKRH